MSNDNAGVVEILTPVTLTFPNLIAAKAFMRNGKAVGDPKFSGSLEMQPDHPQLPALKQAAVAVAKAKWPGCKLADLAFPFVNGDILADKAKAKKKDREFSRGKVVLTARSKFQPNLSAIVNGAIVEYDDTNRAAAGPKFFTGAEVLAQVNFVAYDKVDDNAKDGVTAYLNMVMATGKGKRLAGGRSAADTFKGYVGSASAEDPTGGAGDDDLPF